MHNPVTQLLAFVDISSFPVPIYATPFFSTSLHISSPEVYTRFHLTHWRKETLFNKKHRLNITTVLNK